MATGKFIVINLETMSIKQKYENRNRGNTEEFWLVKSDEFLNNAIGTFKNTIDFDCACHNAHIGIELLLKALSLHLQNKFLKTHSLIDICDDLNEKIELPTELILNIDRMKNWFEIRYPFENEDQIVEAGDFCLTIVEKVLEQIYIIMPESFHEICKNIDPNNKQWRVLMSQAIQEK